MAQRKRQLPHAANRWRQRRLHAMLAALAAMAALQLWRRGCAASACWAL